MPGDVKLEFLDVGQAEVEFIESRVRPFLGVQGMAIAKENLVRLLVFAYAQGCSDTLRGLEQSGRLRWPKAPKP